jgi:hypothetical protein
MSRFVTHAIIKLPLHFMFPKVIERGGSIRMSPQIYGNEPEDMDQLLDTYNHWRRTYYRVENGNRINDGDDNPSLHGELIKLGTKYTPPPHITKLSNVVYDVLDIKLGKFDPKYPTILTGECTVMFEDTMAAAFVRDLVKTPDQVQHHFETFPRYVTEDSEGRKLDFPHLKRIDLCEVDNEAWARLYYKVQKEKNNE